MALEKNKVYAYIKDMSYSFVNFFKTKSPMRHNRTLDQLSPAEYQELLIKYRASVGFGEGTPDGKGFDKYAGARASDANYFSDVKAPDGTNFSAKLSVDNASTTAVKAGLKDALTLSDKTEKAQKAFNASIAKVTRYIKDSTSEFHAEDFASYLQEAKNNASSAIAEQQKSEIKALEAKFADPTFTEHLKTTLGPNSTPQHIADIQKAMIDKLQADHKKELKEFDSSLDDPITKMHKAAQDEQFRVTFLAKMYENDKEVRAAINRLAEERSKGPNSGVTIELDDRKNPKSAVLKGISIEDVTAQTTFKTITGKLLNYNKDEGSFSLKLPNRILSAGFYRSGHHKTKATLLNMAQAVRACGHDSINMSVNHKNEKHAKELAREMYESCIEAGFDPKKITITLNNDKLNSDKLLREKLFADCPSRLDAANAKGEKYKKEWEESKHEVYNTISAGEFKEKVNAYHVTHPEPEPLSAPSTATRVR